MSDRLDELGEDSIVVLVTFASDDRLVEYVDQHALDYTVLRDPTRASYRAFGLGRGRLTRVWGLRAARRYLEVIRRNGLRGLHVPTDDTRQLGGDFVIDPTGTLTWGFWGEGPDDRPSVDAIVAAVRDSRK